MPEVRAVGIVPAAGSAERFGGRKLLADIDGAPLLEHTLAALLNGGIRTVIVVLGPDSDQIRTGVSALGGRAVRVVVNPDPSRGMLSSIQEGLLTFDRDEGIAVLPGDMPYVRAGTVATLLEVFGRSGAIVSPRYEGKRGHPVILPARLRAEILAADPRGNLHEVLRKHLDERHDVDVMDRGVVRDVDTLADMESTP